MTPEPGGRGRAEVAVLCDEEGRITRVLRTPEWTSPEGWLGGSLGDFVDEGSRLKVANMLERTREEGAVFGWELGVVKDGGVELLQFAAGSDEGRFLVVGGPAGTDVEAFYQEMMRVSNEQANELRQRVKDGSRSEADSPGDADPYEEMTRLNNELAMAQREMAKKNVELEQLNEQKVQFLGMAAHDLRNPLGVIMGYSEILQDTVEDLSPAHREMLEVIESSSEFMLGMVNELLDVSRIESGRLDLTRTRTDLARLLGKNLALNRLVADRKEIAITLEVEEALPPVYVDPAKIDQVMNNLVSNAVKYSHRGTAVEVWARPVGPSGQAVEIQVRDRGQGIPADEVEGLFKAFGTTSVSTTGGEDSTGLGLMIVRRIVEGHDGRIEVESTVGEGSTFTVRFPVHGGAPEEAAEALTADPEPLEASAGEAPAHEDGGLHVLVVDDSRMVRRVTQGLLEAQGHSVHEAESGEEALVLLDDLDRCDLVLLDLEMPGLDGEETLAELRAGSARWREVPVVFLSGARPEDVSERLEGHDALDFLTKPVDGAELAGLLERARSAGSDAP